MYKACSYIIITLALANSFIQRSFQMEDNQVTVTWTALQETNKVIFDSDSEHSKLQSKCT